MTHPSVSCPCGSVTASVIDETPCGFSAICHCSDCRAATGAPFFWANAWPLDKVVVSGETVYHKEIQNERHACAQCGSFTHEIAPSFGMALLPAARLENPTPPMMHIYTRSSVYAIPDDGLPRFDEMPPVG